MSHIYPDVRLDAVRILDLLYPALGPLVTSGWQDVLASESGAASMAKIDGPESNQGHGDRVLRCYLSLLGISLNFDSTTSINASQVVSSDLAPGARLLILRSMHAFFQNTSNSNKHGSSEDLKCPTWFWEPCFTSLPELDAFRSAFDKVSTDIPPGNIFDADETCLVMSDMQFGLGKNWNSAQISTELDSLAHFTIGAASQEAVSDNKGSSQRRLFKLISPLLVSVFLDAAPTAFSPNEQPHTGTLSTSARLISEIAGLTLALWRGTTQSDPKSRECLGRLLTHMAVYFPFGNEWDENARIEMINLNLIYCELVGLLAVTENQKRKKEEANTSKQMSNVSDFVINLLHEEGRQDRVRQPVLRGQTYIDLLPTIWLLLTGKESRDCTSTIDALLSHWNSLKAHDPTKRVGAEFIGRLWLVS
jgi:pre-rRNA-processing protein IPI1